MIISTGYLLDIQILICLSEFALKFFNLKVLIDAEKAKLQEEFS